MARNFMWNVKISLLKYKIGNNHPKNKLHVESLLLHISEENNKKIGQSLLDFYQNYLLFINRILYSNLFKDSYIVRKRKSNKIKDKLRMNE